MPVKRITKKREADLVNLSKMSENELRSLARISDSPEGKVLLEIIDTYIYNRMVEVFKRRAGDPTDWTMNAAFDQGRGAGVTDIKLALLRAEVELNRRAKDGK